MNVKKTFLIFTLAAVLAPATSVRAESVYTNNFEKNEIGKVPEELMVLDGQFAVQEESGNKFLELPGAPTDTYTVMFGPVTNANIAISSRIFTTSKGRRMPAFGVALCGVGGYKLQISAAKKEIELFKGDKVVQTVEYNWKSGEWTTLRLSAVRIGDGVKVEGRISQANAEPTGIIFEEHSLLSPGRASIFGTPFSGTPIRFDDLTISTALEEK